MVSLSLFLVGPGVFNDTEHVPESVSNIPDTSGNFPTDFGYLNLRDASGGDLTEESRRCGLSKQSRAFPHVCNTWQPANGTLSRKDCRSASLRTQTLLVVERVYCAGMDGAGLSLQHCSSNLTQRIYFQANDGSVRIGALLDKHGQRSGGECVTALSDGTSVSVQACSTASQAALRSQQTMTVENIAEEEEMQQVRFNSTGKCLAILSSSSRQEDLTLPNLHVLNDRQLGARFVQKTCPSDRSSLRAQLSAKQQAHVLDYSSEFASFQLINATNECPDDFVLYDVTSASASGAMKDGGSHLGRYEHSASVLSPGDASFQYESSDYGNLMVFGGRDLVTGMLSDVWSYNIQHQRWTQLHDGGGWRTASDAHLHGQPTINAADYESSYHGEKFPSPREGHTSVAMFSQVTSSITKTIDIKETSYVNTASTYRDARFKAGRSFQLVFPDDVALDDSPYRIARTREYGMWTYAKDTKGWDTVTYPFDFVFSVADSLVEGYKVTLLNHTSVKLVRPTEYNSSSTTQISDDKFVKNVVLGTSDYQEQYIYSCFSQSAELLSQKLRGEIENGQCSNNPQWADHIESYSIQEIKQRMVESTSTTSGKHRLLVFGGWKTNNAKGLGADGGAPTDELWTFDHSAQLSADDVPMYTPNIHDSPYNTFPCCGTVRLLFF